MFLHDWTYWHLINIFERRTNKSIFFGLVSLDICMTKFISRAFQDSTTANKQSIFYLQQKSKISICKDIFKYIWFDIKYVSTKNISCGRMTM